MHVHGHGCQGGSVRVFRGGLQGLTSQWLKATYISKTLSRTAEINIYTSKAIEKADDIGWFNFQSVPFFRVKNVENGK